jgi:hypothetical protein
MYTLLVAEEIIAFIVNSGDGGAGGGGDSRILFLVYPS